MGMDRLFGDARRLGLGSSLAIVQRNLRLYGWRSTLRKVVRRFVAVDSLHAHHAASLQRQGIAEVDAAPVLFGAPSVLVVGALDLPQCKKYRVLQKVECCEHAGWPCHYASYLDEARVLSYLQVATTLVFYRVPAGTEFEVYMTEARRLGVQVLYDIDDPIFDTAVYSENRNLDYIDPSEKDAILASAPLYRDAMAQADALIFSTTYLAELARQQFNAPCFVWRNLVDATTFSAMEHLSLGGREGRDQCVIAYCSGSRAHEEDFRVSADALLELLAIREELVLRVIGFADLPETFRRFGDRVQQRPFSSYQQYMQALADADICIVPLVADRFNACKSAIRYLEGALCEVPVVASAVGQFEELIDNGVNGVLVEGGNDAWLSALGELLDNDSQRQALAGAAKRHVLGTQRVSSPGVVDAGVIDRITAV